MAAARAALDLAEQAKAVGPIDELEQKVAANPLDHQARFDLATALSAAGKRAEAVNHLIEIVKRDRKWNEDGARKQLVQFFEAWGPTDAATRERPQAAVVDFVFVILGVIVREGGRSSNHGADYRARQCAMIEAGDYWMPRCAGHDSGAVWNAQCR